MIKRPTTTTATAPTTAPNTPKTNNPKRPQPPAPKAPKRPVKDEASPTKTARKLQLRPARVVSPSTGLRASPGKPIRTAPSKAVLKTRPQKVGNKTPNGFPAASGGKPMSHRRNQIHDRLKRKSPWYDSIMSPITGGGVRIPDPVGTETGTYQHIENISVRVNGNGVSGLRVVSPYINDYSNPDLANDLEGLNYQATVNASNANNLLWGWQNTDSTQVGRSFAVIASVMKANARSHRVVSACVIAQAETSSLNDAGEMCAFVTPFAAENASTPYDLFQKKAGSSLLPINVHKPMIARWFPVQSQYAPFNGVETIATNEPYNVSYQDFLVPDPAHTSQDSGIVPFEFGIVCSGLSPNVGTVRYQIIVNYEFIPLTDTSMITTVESPVDPMETELVETWVADAPITEVVSQQQASAAPHDSMVPEEPSGFGMVFNVFKELLPLML